jgi:rhodanese-related sulfurtransferase
MTPMPPEHQCAGRMDPMLEAPMIASVAAPNVRACRTALPPGATDTIEETDMYTPTPQQAREFFAQKLAFTTGPFELDALLKRGEPVTVVDVRLPSDYAKGHVPGAVNLPKGKWHTVQGIPADRPAVLYCYNQQCKLAAAAAMELAAHGIRVIEMEGGFDAWTSAGLPVEQPS